MENTQLTSVTEEFLGIQVVSIYVFEGKHSILWLETLR